MKSINVSCWYLRKRQTLWLEIEFVAALLSGNKLPRNEILSWEGGKSKEETWKFWYFPLQWRALCSAAQSEVEGIIDNESKGFQPHFSENGHFWRESYHFFGGKLITLGVYYHFWLASSKYIKSSKKNGMVFCKPFLELPLIFCRMPT